MQEHELVKRAQQGDQDSFCALIQTYEKKIYNVAFRYMRNEYDAQDAAQEAILKMYTNLRKFSFASSFSTWMYRVTANTCLDMLRKRKPDAGLDGFENVFVSPEGNPAAEAENNELGRAIRDAVESLPEKYKTVIVLKDMQGLKYEEIAAILRVSVGTVKSRISRAREQLRDLLVKGGVL